MKKLLGIFVLTLFFGVQLFAGITHDILGYVELSDGSAPDAITFTAYITIRPDETFDEEYPGNGYGPPNYDTGMFGFNVGNFPSDWDAGEIAHIDITAEGETGSGEITLNYDGFQLMDEPIVLSGTTPIELSAFTATYVAEYAYITICWTTETETDVLGFNVYRNTSDDFGTADQVNIDLIEGSGTTSTGDDYAFNDDTYEPETTYYYWLETKDIDGTTEHSESIEYNPDEGDGGYDYIHFDNTHLNNYPNPVTSSTTFSYAIKSRRIDTPVTINIYNLMGQLVESIEASDGTYTWNPGNLPTGIYFYQLKTDSYNEVKKMMIVR